MPRQWKSFKDILSTHDLRNNLLLSLIDDEGNILCANANMQKTLHLDNPRNTSQNFFNLVHPEHILSFRSAIERSRLQQAPFSTELYLRNGCYHPMKWEINYMEQATGRRQYLCVGYKLVDDDRLRQFNQLGEQNYQMIVEGLNTGILFQDNRGELIAANKKAAAILDATLERLYALHNIADLWNNDWNVTDEDGRKVPFSDTPFMLALATGRKHARELTVRLRSGEERCVYFQSQPLFDTDNPGPVSVVTNIEDITLQKKLSGEVQERDTIFKAFLNKTPNLAWVLNENGELRWASDAFYQYFGLAERTAIDRHITDLVPPIVADALYPKHMQVLETGLPVETEERVKWADGTNFVFHINIFPIGQQANQRFVGGHAVNLADKYAVEKKLRDANDRLLLLSRATTDAIWEWDMQTGTIFRNDTLMELIGYHKEEPRGLSWWLRRIHPEDRNRVTDKIKEATDKGQHSWKDEYRFKCFDGSYKHIQDRGYVVYENGLPVKMIGSLQDITDFRDLENQLMEEKLERQKEISETVIRVQEKERTRIGHELHDNVNQILSTTRMFVEMLTPASAEEKKLKAKSIEYLLTSIEEIRKLSKELVVPHFQEKNLLESIYALVEDVQLSSGVRIRFIHDTENNLLSPGKKITLFRIIQEQVKNIIKYSKAGQVEIFLQSSGDEAELIIRDDGIGFDIKQTHRGIGLSNIHDRTRFYNGSVDIQTSPGKGCTLIVKLPLER